MNNDQRAEVAHAKAVKALKAGSIEEAVIDYGSRSALRRVAARYPDLQKRYEELASRPVRGSESVVSASAKIAALLEDLEFLAENGVGHEEASRRVGRPWDSIRRTMTRTGTQWIGDKLVTNTARRFNDFRIAA